VYIIVLRLDWMQDVIYIVSHVERGEWENFASTRWEARTGTVAYRERDEDRARVRFVPALAWRCETTKSLCIRNRVRPREIYHKVHWATTLICVLCWSQSEKELYWDGLSPMERPMKSLSATERASIRRGSCLGGRRRADDRVTDFGCQNNCQSFCSVTFIFGSVSGCFWLFLNVIYTVSVTQEFTIEIT